MPNSKTPAPKNAQPRERIKPTREQYRAWSLEREAELKKQALVGLLEWLEALTPAITKKEKRARARLAQFIIERLND